MPATEKIFDDGTFLSHADLGSPRKMKFLERLNNLLPWHEMENIIEPHYRQAGNCGQRLYPLDLMLRVYIFQMVYNLSDTMAEETLKDSISVRRFVRLRIDSTTPDEITIQRFRRLLEENAISNKISNMINVLLKKHGLLLRKGTIVDAAISPKNLTKIGDQGKRDKT